MSVKSSWNARSSEAFLLRLRALVPFPLEVRFNQNRTLYVHVLERRWNCMRLSLHVAFLEAPAPVVLALASFIVGERKGAKQSLQLLKRFVQEYQSKVYRTPKALNPVGTVHDLRPLYHEVNREYFMGELNLGLTWFGDPSRRPKRRVTFGVYQDSLRLVKIHSLLDDSRIPEFFLAFVLYHEMLHAVVEPYYDAKGRYIVHTPEFKRKERRFRFFKEASQWEKENKQTFFNNSIAGK